MIDQHSETDNESITHLKPQEIGKVATTSQAMETQRKETQFDPVKARRALDTIHYVAIAASERANEDTVKWLWDLSEKSKGQPPETKEALCQQEFDSLSGRLKTALSAALDRIAERGYLDPSIILEIDEREESDDQYFARTNPSPLSKNEGKPGLQVWEVYVSNIDDTITKFYLGRDGKLYESLRFMESHDEEEEAGMTTIEEWDSYRDLEYLRWMVYHIETATFPLPETETEQ